MGILIIVRVCVVVAAAIKALVRLAVGVPEQALCRPDPMRADPLPHGVQAFDKAERRGRITGVGDRAGVMQLAKRALADGNRNQPATTYAVVLPGTFSLMGIGHPSPVDACQ